LGLLFGEYIFCRAECGLKIPVVLKSGVCEKKTLFCAGGTFILIVVFVRKKGVCLGDVSCVLTKGGFFKKVWGVFFGGFLPIKKRGGFCLTPPREYF